MLKTITALSIITASLNLIASKAFAEAPQTLQQETIVPGVSLDGSLIIDESIWVTLLGEPGRHMSTAYERFEDGERTEAAASIRKAASFLYIASNNALAGPNVAVEDAADALTELHQRIERGEVESAEKLRPVFRDAHLAMSRHHAKKTAAAFTKKELASAGNYLRSSARHLQKASYWAEQKLLPDTKETVANAEKSGTRLVEGSGASAKETGNLIETLGERIERFGKSLTDKKPDEQR